MTARQNLEKNSERPRLSPTIAQHLVMDCARMAWAHHRLLGNCIVVTPDQERARRRGAIFHHIILEDPGMEGHGLDVLDYPTWASKAAKAERDQAKANGLIPILTHEAEAFTAGAAEILEQISEKGLDLAEGNSETRLNWEEASEGDPVECTGVLDWLSIGREHIIDLKTTTGSVHPDACATALVNGSGVIQEAAYRSAIETLHPDLAGRTRFTFLFAQTKPPYIVTPIETDGTMRQIGESRWLRAIELWAKCLAKDEWPDHGPGIHTAYAPAWAMARERALEDIET